MVGIEKHRRALFLKELRGLFDYGSESFWSAFFDGFLVGSNQFNLMEFYGDRLINLWLCEMLIGRSQEPSVKGVTMMFSYLSSRFAMAEVVDEYFPSLTSFVSEKRKSDFLESMVAHAYTVRKQRTRETVQRLFGVHNRRGFDFSGFNPKGYLQELLAHSGSVPKYMNREILLGGGRQFLSGILFVTGGVTRYFYGRGESIKVAEKQAARSALRFLAEHFLIGTATGWSVLVVAAPAWYLVWLARSDAALTYLRPVVLEDVTRFPVFR